MADDRKPAPAESAPEAAAAAKGGGINGVSAAHSGGGAHASTRVWHDEIRDRAGIAKAVSASRRRPKPRPKARPRDTKKVSVPMNKLLCNIAGTMGQRYLLVSVTVVGTGGEEFKTKMTDNNAQLRDMAMGALANKTLADLEKPGARNLIRTELINGFNNVLGRQFGPGNLHHRVRHPITAWNPPRQPKVKYGAHLPWSCGKGGPQASVRSPQFPPFRLPRRQRIAPHPPAA